MALQSNHYHHYPQQQASFFQDLHQFMPIDMEEPFDRSTGYLEDALSGWTDRFKRRRVLLFQNNEPDLGRFDDVIQEFLSWNSNGSQFEDLCNSNDPSKSIEGGNTSNHGCSEEVAGSLEPDVISTSHLEEPVGNSNKVSNSYPDSGMEDGTEGRRRRRRRKEEVVVGVVHPFTVVKPADVDGRATLDGINRRILSRPTRPVRHPVGKFACLPRVTTVSGSGLSGKVVVGLTRIHTHGRGTITIIRTRD